MKTKRPWPRWLTESTTSEWMSGVATYAWSLVLRSMIGILLAPVIALACIALLLYLLADFLPKRRSKPLTYPTPVLRRLPRLYRPRGSSDIFAEFQDGTVIQLEPMEAKLYAEACFETVAGAFVYEKTRIRLDESR